MQAGSPVSERSEALFGLHGLGLRLLSWMETTTFTWAKVELLLMLFDRAGTCTPASEKEAGLPTGISP